MSGPHNCEVLVFGSCPIGKKDYQISAGKKHYVSPPNDIAILLDLTGATPEGKINTDVITVQSADTSFDAFDFYLYGNHPLTLQFDKCYKLVVSRSIHINIFTGLGEAPPSKVLDKGVWYINTSQVGLFSVGEVGLEALISRDPEVCLTVFEEDSP